MVNLTRLGDNGVSANILVDNMGRVAKKLRISVTDRCNFACLFCMPNKESVRWIPLEEILTFEEIERVTKVLVHLGIERIRITGGEPLLRRGIENLIGRLRKIDGIRSIDMTTNGWFLKEKAKALKEAGLNGVTVSLHSLKRDRFMQISGVDALPKVIEGIDEAIRVGLKPVKINTVAIKGYNDDEILDLVEFVSSRNLPVRFIEFMPFDGLGIWKPESVMSGKEIIEIIRKRYDLVPLGRKVGDTASLWSLGNSNYIGLITPMTEPFCDDCDRIRLTADGKLLSCLFDVEYHDLKSMIRNGGTDDELAEFIVNAVKRKPPGVAYMQWTDNGWEKPRSMNAIGG